jgi:hypothetical protein
MVRYLSKRFLQITVFAGSAFVNSQSDFENYYLYPIPLFFLIAGLAGVE